MQVLFNICCLLAVSSAGLVYPSSYGHDLLSQSGSLLKLNTPMETTTNTNMLDLSMLRLTLSSINMQDLVTHMYSMLAL
ncbi:hypothetical protein CBL_02778 [Carabus blaptoides fortunei]